MLYTLTGMLGGLFAGCAIATIINRTAKKNRSVEETLVAMIITSIGIGMGIATDYNRYMSGKYLPF